jgi:hypothetical protein
VQGAELIYTVPWTTELRAEHAVQMGLQKLNGEIGYGMTAGLLTTSAAAWSEILGGLAPDQVPEERPFLIAAYQSEAEARAALHLRPAGRTNGPMPGDRPADSVLATKVVEMLDEPVQQNPEEAFLAAVSLSSDPDFVKARRALFSYVDGLAIDESPETEIATTLSALERDYNEAVHQFTVSTRKRRAVTLLPRALGAVAQLAGVPFAKTAGGGISTVAGHFVPAPSPVDEPGKALAMIRAAFRD